MLILQSALVVSLLGLVFGVSLVAASKKFHVEEDPKIEEITELLPGANCGACGYTGCAAYAKAIVEEDADIDKCMPGGDETIKKISEVMGVEAESGAKMTARVLCQGMFAGVKDKFRYQGAKDCASASMILDGPKECSFGCIGYGDCIKVCPFDAISRDKDTGAIVISEEKCTACGKCVEACPKDIIKLIPAKNQPPEKKKSRQLFYVACMSTEKGGIAKKKCKYACIGCKKCEKECKFDAIHVNNFLAEIDYDKCVNCGKCYKVCPTGAIISLNPKIKK